MALLSWYEIILPWRFEKNTDLNYKIHMWIHIWEHVKVGHEWANTNLLFLGLHVVSTQVMCKSRDYTMLLPLKLAEFKLINNTQSKYTDIGIGLF